MARTRGAGGSPVSLAAVATVATVGLMALIALVTLVVWYPRSPTEPDGQGARAGRQNATVVRVVDGDTLVARIGDAEEPVRLIGIDSPESVARDQPVECYGPEASDRLGRLLPPGTAIRLERDLEPRDRYDRLLAYVYRVGDDLLVNHDQVSLGFAEAMEYPPNTALSAALAEAQAAARTAGAGLWSAC